MPNITYLSAPVNVCVDDTKKSKQIITANPTVGQHLITRAAEFLEKLKLQPLKAKRLEFILKCGVTFIIATRQEGITENASFIPLLNAIFIFSDRLSNGGAPAYQWPGILAHEIVHAYKFWSHAIRNKVDSDEVRKINAASPMSDLTASFYPLQDSCYRDLLKALEENKKKVELFGKRLNEKGLRLSAEEAKNFNACIISLKTYQPRIYPLVVSVKDIPALGNPGFITQVNSRPAKLPLLPVPNPTGSVYMYKIKPLIDGAGQYEISAVHCESMTDPRARGIAFAHDMAYLAAEQNVLYLKEPWRELTELHASLVGELPEAVLTCFYPDIVAHDAINMQKTEDILSRRSDIINSIQHDNNGPFWSSIFALLSPALKNEEISCLPQKIAGMVKKFGALYNQELMISYLAAIIMPTSKESITTLQQLINGSHNHFTSAILTSSLITTTVSASFSPALAAPVIPDSKQISTLSMNATGTVAITRLGKE